MRVDADNGSVLSRTPHASSDDPKLRARSLGAALAAGLPGVALQQAEEAHLSGDDDLMSQARATLTAAVQVTQETPLTGTGLLDGACGLSLVTQRFAEIDDRYHRTAQRMHERVLNQILATDWNFGSSGRKAADYDVVSGAAGALLYLSVVRNGDPSEHIAADHAIHFLTWLLEREGWERLAMTSSGTAGSLYQRFYPEGLIDLGAAHGVAGILRALALAGRSFRVDHDGLARGVERFVDIAEQGHWPRAIPLSDIPEEPPPTNGWCYGSTGMAHAVLSVAKTLGDDQLRRWSLQLCRQLVTSTNSTDPTMCHGQAGLLLMAMDIGVDDVHTAQLRDLLVAKDLDDKSLLEGAAGVHLALGQSHGGQAVPNWRRALFSS